MYRSVEQTFIGEGRAVRTSVREARENLALARTVFGSSSFPVSQDCIVVNFQYAGGFSLSFRKIK